MDSLPPNDPNRNGNGNTAVAAAKEQPFDGRQRRRGSGGQQQRDGEERMDMMGDALQNADSAMVVVMFLMGAATYLLQEHCVC